MDEIRNYRGSNPLASSLRPANAGATAGTPASGEARSKSVFSPRGNKAVRHSSASAERRRTACFTFTSFVPYRIRSAIILALPKTSISASQNITKANCGLAVSPSRSFLFPPREQIPNARVAKKEPTPDQRGENDRREKREFLRLDAHVRRDRAAEIAVSRGQALRLHQPTPCCAISSVENACSNIEAPAGK